MCVILKITMEILHRRIITVEATSVMEERFLFLQWTRRFYSEGKWKKKFGISKIKEMVFQR